MGSTVAVVWAGLVTGSIYCLVGVGYFLVFQAARVLNFSLGGTAGLAGIAMATTTGTPLLVSCLYGIGLAIVATVLIDVVVTRPVQARESGHFGAVLALAAALFVCIQLTGHFFTQSSVLGKPLVSDGFHLVGQPLSYQGVLTLVLTVAATVGLSFWLRASRAGRLLAALGDAPEAARVLSIPIRTIRLVAIGLAGLATGVAGVLYIGRSPMDFQTGFELGLLGFLAVVIGGLASVWGSLCGGVILGLLQSVVAYVIGARWFDYVLVGVVVIAFRVRPQGLFATSVRDWD